MAIHTYASHTAAQGRAVIAGLAALAVFPSCANGATCAHSAERRLAVQVAAVEEVQIYAGSGSLSVRGIDGLGEVSARGTACASTAAALDQTQLRAETKGNVVIVKVEMPSARRLAAGASLDLEVALPRDLPVTIGDSSGDVAVSGTGRLEVNDSSGDVSVSAVSGDVSVNDGSGAIAIAKVAGSVTVRDGSGAIAIRDVAVDVDVHDGSGDMQIEEIGGNVAVRDGAGGIDVQNVAGQLFLNGDDSGRVRTSGVAATAGAAAPGEC